MREDTSFMTSTELWRYLASQQNKRWPESKSIRSYHARQLKTARRAKRDAGR